MATISGTANGETLNGSDQADTLMGLGGNDILCGYGGNDRLGGGEGDDTLGGGEGNDTLDGGAGNDLLLGERGNDFYLFGRGSGQDSIFDYDLTAGNVDTVRFAADVNPADVTYWRDQSNLYFQITGTTDILSVRNFCLGPEYQIEGVLFADGTVWTAADLKAGAIVYGTDANETLNGSDQADTLKGLGGNDILYGYGGNDILNGGSGSDILTGGDGNDTYYVDNVNDVVIETNATASTGGTDLVYSYLSAYTLGANIENGRILSSGIASLTGNALGNLLYAGAGNNVLDGDLGTDAVSYGFATTGVTVSLAITTAQATGGSGSDTLLNIENLTGSSYADTLTGNAGSNTLNGGAGVDTMTGGDGNDTYYVDNVNDVVIETNATASTGGTDQVYSSLSAYTLSANVENGRINTTGTANLTGNSLGNILYAGAGNNVFDGAAGTDTVTYLYATAGVTLNLEITAAQATGGSGSDTLLSIENLVGSSYADTLTGNAGNNYLTGGTGDDTLSGGVGNDVLIGGLGADNLTGGTGADRFDFNILTELGLTSTTWDTITDFKTSDGDKIDLQGVDANTALTGDQAFTFLGSVSTFTGDATGQLRFDAATHILYGSTDADTDAEFAIFLAGVTSLTSTDLVL